MSECSETQGSPEPTQSDAERRRIVIQQCCKHALSKGQEALEREYMDLRRIIDNYMGGYCRYLPEICDYESAQDFIACVVYGMGIEAVSLERGSKLLYGAQVALTAFRPRKDAK